MQKFAVEFHDDASLDCWVPGSIDNEHASPENSPVDNSQADERDHDVFLPFPKCDTVRRRYSEIGNEDKIDGDIRPNHQRCRRGKDGQISC